MNDEKVLNQLNELFKFYPQIIVAYFYGSQVTGKTNKQSDLDVAVVADDPTTFDYGDLYLKISQIIKDAQVDLRIVSPKSSPTYLFQVLKNGRRIYERESLERVRFEARVMSNFYDNEHMRNVYDKYLKQSFN